MVELVIKGVRIFILKLILNLLLESNLLGLNWNDDLILDRLSLVNELGNQLDHVAWFSSGQEISGLLSSDLDIAIQLLLPVTFALTERSG